MRIAQAVPVSLAQRVSLVVDAVLLEHRGFHGHEDFVEEVPSVVARADNVCHASELVSFSSCFDGS
jgi:hypothetical protein